MVGAVPGIYLRFVSLRVAIAIVTQDLFPKVLLSSQKNETIVRNRGRK
jgi:hypothetical protein